MVEFLLTCLFSVGIIYGIVFCGLMILLMLLLGCFIIYFTIDGINILKEFKKTF